MWPFRQQKQKPRQPSSFEATLPGNEPSPVLDPRSSTWAFVVAHASGEISRLREMNDSRKYDAADTAWIRGRIQALKDLIALTGSEYTTGSPVIPGSVDPADISGGR